MSARKQTEIKRCDKGFSDKDGRSLWEKNMQENEKRLRANWVWMKLAEMYGNSFTKSFGHQASDTWVNGLALLDKSEVVEGLNKLLIDGHVFPPSLPEFIKLGKRVKKPTYHNVLTLPKLRTEEERRNGLTQIKNLMDKNK